MKIFSVSQIKDWDQYTIQNEPVTSLRLMERAAHACSDWLISRYKRGQSFKIFCGKGNNGGDGLAIARHLLENLYPVSVYIIGEKTGSEDFQKNYQKLSSISKDIFHIESIHALPEIKDEIVIDALLGTGLNKKPASLLASVIEHLNRHAKKIISIDLPSGLFADTRSVNNPVIHSTFTLTFQAQKLAFLMAENAPYTGKVVTLDIKLSKEYSEKQKALYELIDPDMIRAIYKPRNSFAHKGNYGYACLLAGSYGMMGAAVLSARACFRIGVGKLNCYIPKSGYDIMQTSVPEAMCTIFGEKYLERR